jgi:hypothetical protein
VLNNISSKCPLTCRLPSSPVRRVVTAQALTNLSRGANTRALVQPQVIIQRSTLDLNSRILTLTQSRVARCTLHAPKPAGNNELRSKLVSQVAVPPAVRARNTAPHKLAWPKHKTFTRKTSQSSCPSQTFCTMCRISCLKFSRAAEFRTDFCKHKILAHFLKSADK